MAAPTASTESIVMNLVEMEEVRVDMHKIMLPIKLKGTESDTEKGHLVLFYLGGIGGHFQRN